MFETFKNLGGLGAVNNNNKSRNVVVDVEIRVGDELQFAAPDGEAEVAFKLLGVGRLAALAEGVNTCL